jgi:hypothetical protein
MKGEDWTEFQGMDSPQLTQVPRATNESRRLARERAQRFRDKKFQDADTPTEGGYVYYARSTTKIKIGFSKNPWSRMSELKRDFPDIVLIAKEPGTFQLEKRDIHSSNTYGWMASGSDLHPN